MRDPKGSLLLVLVDYSCLLFLCMLHDACCSLFGLQMLSAQALADSEERQRPGAEAEGKFDNHIYDSIQQEEGSAPEFVAVPDRWRQFYKGKWYDPYNQNVLKGDIPVFGSPGHEWFFEATIVSDSQNGI